jgi:hypothetical protein
LSSLCLQLRGPLGQVTFPIIEEAINSLQRLTQLTFGYKGCYSAYREYPAADKKLALEGCSRLEVRFKTRSRRIQTANGTEQVLRLENVELTNSSWLALGARLRCLELRQTAALFKIRAPLLSDIPIVDQMVNLLELHVDVRHLTKQEQFEVLLVLERSCCRLQVLTLRGFNSPNKNVCDALSRIVSRMEVLSQ